MPARAANRDLASDDVGSDIAPQSQQTDATTFSSDGQVPAVASDVPAQQQATASELAYDQSNLAVLDQGMHEPEAYLAACQAAGKPERWDTKYAAGYTSANQWMQPYEGPEIMEWALKAGQSASQAVRDFVKGPTIADYRAIGVAQDLAELADDMGDQQFDALFGSNDTEQDVLVPHDQRLAITSDMYTTPYVDKMKAIAATANEPQVAAQDPVLPPPVEEQREDKPKLPALEDEPPIVVAEDLGRQPEREIV
jgi:hypothetical protein